MNSSPMMIWLLNLFLVILAVNGQTETTSPAGYTDYQESSTDNCTGSASICTQQLPFEVNNPPDVWLSANVSVPSIILIVNNVQANLNLNAKVASLVTLTAGVSVGITTVQLKILGVKAQVQLAVKFDKVVEIVNRTLDSIDLNPLLATVIQGVQTTVNNVV